MNRIEKLESYRIDTRSPNAAIASMHRLGLIGEGASGHKDMVVELGNTDAPSDDERELDYTFRYMVTLVIEKPDLGGQLLVDLAYTKAKTFIENHQYVFAVPDEDAEPKLDAVGNVKPKKGAKKELARKVYDEKIRNKDLARKDAIAILMEDVGMSAGGASTYYANLKAGRM